MGLACGPVNSGKFRFFVLVPMFRLVDYFVPGFSKTKILIMKNGSGAPENFLTGGKSLLVKKAHSEFKTKTKLVKTKELSLLVLVEHLGSQTKNFFGFYQYFLVKIL